MKQDSRGLVLQAQGFQYLGERVVTTAAEAVIQDNDFTLAINLATPGPLTIALRPPASLPTEPGSARLRVRDKAGNAGTHAITLDGNGALIDGSATLVISTNGGNADIEWTGTGWTSYAQPPGSAPDSYTPANPGDWSPVPTTKSSALDQLAARVEAGGDTMDVTFDVAPGPVDVGKGYYRKADNTVSLAQGDSDVTVGQGLVGLYQGNANELAVGYGSEMDVYLQADLDGVTGPVPAPIPVPGQPFFLSTTVAGAFTTQDPTDLAAVGSYSVAAGILSDVTGYNPATGGVVRGQFAPQPPVGPLGTGSSPPTDPPYYVDPHTFDCPMATSPGDLVALDGTDDAVVLADRALGKPAFAFVYDKPTATTCRVYNGVSIIFGGYGGIVNGGTYWLGTAGQMDVSPPADGSGEIIQQVAVGINAAGNIRPAIDINGWDPNTP